MADQVKSLDWVLEKKIGEGIILSGMKLRQLLVADQWGRKL